MASRLSLPDGRNLDYFVTGAKQGIPLVWIHGTPSGYIPIPSLVTVCEKKGVPLIVFSRAGYGGSSRQKDRRIIDIVADIEALLSHLGFDQCFVGGWSGGGPHALACAARLTSCIATIVIASVAPYDADGLEWLNGQGQDNVDEFHASMKGEAALQEYCKPQREELLTADAETFTQLMSSILPDADKRALLEDKEFGEYTPATFKEGLKLSSDGWVDDDLAFVKPWGFDVSETKCPVFMYHGDKDLMVPYAHGEWLASHVPEKMITKHFQEGEGHISIFLGRADGMLDELLNVAK